MISKGAIICSEPETGEFISTIFIVPKKNGKFRPVINLKYLNEFVHYDHFKQETFKIVLDLLQEGDFLTSIDLSDAYFSIPIHPDFQKYLKFYWKGVLYKFVCLPFGLKSAPFVFTKVLKPVYAWFRQRNIRCSYYIDDSLNMNRDVSICTGNTQTIVSTLDSLGFVINRKKSVLVPTQKIVFFGFVIDSVQFKVFLTEEKVQKIRLKAKSLLEKGFVVVRDLASFIGLIINAFYAVLEAPLHYRCLERNKLVGLGSEMNFDNEVNLSSQSVDELKWWYENVELKNGKQIRPKQVQFRCRTDASLEGWGAVNMDLNKHANGRWSFEEKQSHINYLELMAIFYALQVFYPNENGVHIEIQSDNISAVKYVNDMGGITSEKLDKLAKSIWEWCLIRNIYISANYIPGIQNTADFFSRHFSDSIEWMLKRSVFDRLCKHFFQPDIDLFASSVNRQLERFVSWFPAPGACHCDAFSVFWGDYMPYMFPPFNLMGKVINKIVDDKVDLALCVFPYWNSQAWFPVLMDNICDFPVRLPRHKDLLVMPHSGEFHPLARSMRIIAVTVSGRRCRIKDFRKKLHPFSPVHGDKVPGSSISLLGGTGWFGTIAGLGVPFRRLRL